MPDLSNIEKQVVKSRKEESTCSEYSTPLAPYDFAIASILSLILVSKEYRNLNEFAAFSQAC